MLVKVVKVCTQMLQLMDSEKATNNDHNGQSEIKTLMFYINAWLILQLSETIMRKVSSPWAFHSLALKEFRQKLSNSNLS